MLFVLVGCFGEDIKSDEICFSQVALFFLTKTERTGKNDLNLWQERFK